jgi:hypothetical protein
MQDFSVESKTSRISSLSTSWQDLEARYKSSNEVNMTPRSPRTKPEKMKNSEDPVRKLLNRVGQWASSNPKRNWRQGLTCRWGGDSRRLGNRHRAKEAVARPKWAQAVPAHSWPSKPPFGLASTRAIYSLEARHHTSTHSPSAAEEQRREGHHLREERVELVD